MREKVRMVSSAGTGHFYTTDKNKRTTPDKLEMKKYDPVVRKHVMYKEGKIKYHSILHGLSTWPRPGFFIYGTPRGDTDHHARIAGS